MSWRAWADSSRRKYAEWIEYPVEIVKENMRSGTVRPCLVTRLLEIYPDAQPTSAEDEDVIRQVSSSLYAGGIDPPVISVLTFILYMTLYPDVQKCAQDEVDRVVGRSRLPQMDDCKQMPYLECLYQELHRIAPPAPVLPHRAMADDRYDGFDIPKDTSVYANVWAMCHDETVYPDPDVFDPMRFSDTAAQPDPRKVTFGFGGRACPGRHFAQSQIFITVSSILWAYNILPTIDENGFPQLPKADFTFGHLSMPKEFRCRIVPRSQDVVRFLQRKGDE
ncbi:cytochrome P450 [Exidia glandulosa HHB12029]|uniref:Cytochrome P450 n=1 Tax=Exidia glandulosa HHB12029 TaxID=1314781 RepID=A0A165NSG1_EXIGL|nr:cytochrome P450 [Exidia glandulosa HHB12029]